MPKKTKETTKKKVEKKDEEKKRYCQNCKYRVDKKCKKTGDFVSRKHSCEDHQWK